MTVQKKAEKKEVEESIVDIEALILKGGSSSNEEESNEKKTEKSRMHVYVPLEMVKKIDEARKNDFVSRNTWILQAIMEKLNGMD